MTITRDGKEYKLTENELHEAYDEFRHRMYETRADDLLSEYEELEGADAYTICQMIIAIADECMEKEYIYDFCSDEDVQMITQRAVEDYLEDSECWKENA